MGSCAVFLELAQQITKFSKIPPNVYGESIPFKMHVTAIYPLSRVPPKSDDIYPYVLFVGRPRRFRSAPVVPTRVGVNRRGQGEDTCRVSLSVNPGPSQALPGRLRGVFRTSTLVRGGSRRLASMSRATVGQVRTDGILLDGNRIRGKRKGRGGNASHLQKSQITPYGKKMVHPLQINCL